MLVGPLISSAGRGIGALAMGKDRRSPRAVGIVPVGAATYPEHHAAFRLTINLLRCHDFPLAGFVWSTPRAVMVRRWKEHNRPAKLGMGPGSRIMILTPPRPPRQGCAPAPRPRIERRPRGRSLGELEGEGVVQGEAEPAAWFSSSPRVSDPLRWHARARTREAANLQDRANAASSDDGACP